MQLVNEILVPAGFECLEAEWVEFDRTLRVYIERDGAMNLDQCETAHRLLLNFGPLDDMFNSPYTLEVSSPGIDRPLRKVEHFVKAIGQQVEVRYKDAKRDRKRVGQLVAVQQPGANADGKVEGAAQSSGVSTKGATHTFVHLETAEGLLELPLGHIEKAHIVHSGDGNPLH